MNQLDLLTLKVEHHTTECVSVKPRMRSRGTQVNDNIFGWKLVDAASSPICATRKRKEMTSRNWIVTTPISSNEKNSSTCNHACSTPLKSPAHVNTTRKRKRLTFDESMSPVPCISGHDDESYRLPSTICVSSETSVNLSSPCPFHLRNSHAERERARTVMERHSKIYLGVDQDWLSVLHLITYKMEKLYNSDRNLDTIYIVFLVLRKLKLNGSFDILGHVFHISVSQAAKIFRKHLPFLSDHLQELIVWPSSNSIKKTLPVGFRKSFRKVETIGDCLEIEIQKPTSAFAQALKWSSYKSANTIKYFVSITPNGIYNFCSKGYGGRTTDEMITSNCGYLNVVRPHTEVMVDRGFKKIEPMVLSRKATLVRPPSVSASQKLSKKDFLSARKIAGLRIHVEREIRRIREFKFLAPHAVLNNRWCV